MSSAPSPSTTPAVTGEPSPPPPPGTANPAGGGVGPSPLQIGKSFIKQYYKVLSTTPSQIHRFYQPDSAVSRGLEPSAPTNPSALAEVMTAVTANGEEGEVVRQAFFDWAGKGINEVGEDAMDVLRIDFERGAIDAQESVGGGILLVVTGHMFLPSKPLTPCPFVHTFFLNNRAPPGRKRQFYVKNDVLRFLLPVVEMEVKEEVVLEVAKVEEEVVVPETPTAPAEIEPVAVEEEKVEEVVQEAEAPTPELMEEPADIPPETTIVEETEFSGPPAEEEKVEEVPTPVEVVEEVEQEPAIEEPTPEPLIELEPAAEEEKIDVTEPPPPVAEPAAVSPSTDVKRSGSKRNRRRRGGKSSRSNSPPNGSADTEEETPSDAATKEELDTEPEQPKKPGSWASLVATGKAPPKEDSTPNNRKGSKSDRRGSPKVHRDEARDKSTTNHDEPAKAPPQSQQPRADRAQNKETATNASSSSPAAPQSQMIQRSPEATLFIRNIPDATKESEIRALFQPFGVTTGNKILGVTLNANRGFCFVDFDGTAAVDAVVAEAQSSVVKDNRTGRKVESSFMVHGRVLEVERKVDSLFRNAERLASSGGGGGGGGGGRRYNRSRSPKDGGGRYGSRGSRGSGMRRSPPRDGGRRTSGGGGGGGGGSGKR